MSEQKEEIVQSIKESYLQACGKALTVYGVPHLYLKDFVSSESDRKKGALKVPDEAFKIKEEEVKADTYPMKALLHEMPNFQKTKARSLYQKNKTEKSVMIEEFKVLKVLGKGSFGKVRT